MYSAQFKMESLRRYYVEEWTMDQVCSSLKLQPGTLQNWIRSANSQIIKGLPITLETLEPRVADGKPLIELPEDAFAIEGCDILESRRAKALVERKRRQKQTSRDEEEDEKTSARPKDAPIIEDAPITQSVSKSAAELNQLSSALQESQSLADALMIENRELRDRLDTLTAKNEKYQHDSERYSNLLKVLCSLNESAGTILSNLTEEPQ